MKTWWCLLILGICVLDGCVAQKSKMMKGGKERKTRGFFPLDFSTKKDFTISCGGSSSKQKTIWQNSDYPRSEELPGLCFLQLTPPPDTCAYRVLFDELDLRSGEEDAWLSMLACNPNAPYFKATTPEDFTAVYCQKMNGLEGLLPVVPGTTEPTVLQLQLVPSAKMKFRVNVTAVSCDDIKTYESPDSCGIKKQDLPELRKEQLRPSDDEESQESDALPGRQNRRIQKRKNKNRKKQIKNKAEQLKYSTNLSPLIKKAEKELAKAEKEGVLVKVDKKGTKVLGVETSVHEYPWNVYIESKLGEGVFLPCNGILVGNDMVLTSRACAIWNPQQPFSVENMLVYIGDHNVLDAEDVVSVSSTVSKVTVPLVNGLYDTEDQFAILHLSNKLELSDTIRPICMPVNDNNFAKDSGVIVGWDWSGAYNAVHGVPYESKVSLTDDSTCYAQIEFLEANLDSKKEFNMQYASEDIQCTLDQDTDDGSVCLGEGGSPLIQLDHTGSYYLTGVASGLNICGYGGSPNVFSKVDADNQFLNIALA